MFFLFLNLKKIAKCLNIVDRGKISLARFLRNFHNLCAPMRWFHLFNLVDFLTAEVGYIL